MKKIFAIALAVVMVLSIASVAGALWEPTPADPATDFRIQVSVEKYALETGTYGYKYVATETITAANAADVYYVIKATLPSNPNAAEEAASITVKYDGIKGTSRTWDVDNLYDYVAGADGGTIYYDGNGNWKTSNSFVNDPAKVVVQARCFDTSVASIDVEASCNRDLTEEFSWKGYQIKLVEEYQGGNDILNISKGNDYIQFEIADDGQASKYADSGANSTLESDLFKALGFTADQLNAGEVYMTDANLRAAFGFSYKVTDSVDWTATNYPIIVDTNVGIPKTGDNASVIGFAMIMVAVVAAAVAVRKVNA